MFTVEFDHDEIELTIMDDTGQNEDLKIHVFDDIVYIRQFEPTWNQNHSLAISPDMWEQLIMAINSPEGAYLVDRKNIK